MESFDPDLIGKITSLLQPKYQSKLKQASKKLKKAVESTVNFSTDIVNVIDIGSKNEEYLFQFNYRSKDLDFDIVGSPSAPFAFSHSQYQLTEFHSSGVTEFLNAINRRENQSLYISSYSDPKHTFYFRYKNFTIKKVVTYGSFSLVIDTNIQDPTQNLQFDFPRQGQVVLELDYEKKSDKIRLNITDPGFIIPELPPIYMTVDTWIPALEEVEKVPQ